MDASIVTSPTGKAVIFSGGFTSKSKDELYELSGNSLESLEWNILEQKLQYPRGAHASIPIPNEVSENLCQMYEIETQKAKDNTNWCTIM